MLLECLLCIRAGEFNCSLQIPTFCELTFRHCLNWVVQTESIFDTVLDGLPFYYEFKAIFILYLTMPSTQGMQIMNFSFFLCSLS